MNENGLTKTQESAKYQEMLDEVERIVQEISGPGADLDEIVAKVQKGYDLIKMIRRKLDSTREQIERLRIDEPKADSDKDLGSEDEE